MTANPMRPKSPLGAIRAGPPTLMPARRALQSAHNAHQHSSILLAKTEETSDLVQSIRATD